MKKALTLIHASLLACALGGAAYAADADIDVSVPQYDPPTTYVGANATWLNLGNYDVAQAPEVNYGDPTSVLQMYRNKASSPFDDAADNPTGVLLYGNYTAAFRPIQGSIVYFDADTPYVNINSMVWQPIQSADGVGAIEIRDGAKIRLEGFNTNGNDSGKFRMCPSNGGTVAGTMTGGELYVAGFVPFKGSVSQTRNSSSGVFAVCDGNGYGIFTQSGGIITIEGSLSVSSNVASLGGTYVLSGGELRVIGAGSGGSGIRTINGAGGANGVFDWQGGTLYVARVSENLTNSGTGILNPGGTGVVGGMAINNAAGQTKQNITYRQGKDAALVIDIAGKNRANPWTTGDSAANAYSSIDWFNDDTTNGTLNQNEFILEDGTTITINLINPEFDIQEGDSFNIVTADILTIEGDLNIVSSQGQFSYTTQLDDNGRTQLLAVYHAIPEPASVALLLALTALACTSRRHRR